MKYKVGFIGTGNMGSALASAVFNTESSLVLCDNNTEKAEELCLKLKGSETADIETLAKNCEFIFLAVKPNVILKIAEGIKNIISKETVVVTMAAGVSLADICGALGSERVIRIMPNTPAAVGEGMILYYLGKETDENAELEFLRLMSKAGRVDKLDEKLFDAAAALSGCGPAFVYMFAEALADGAVSCGVPREKAELYAAQTLLGSANMLLKSGKHPEKLKDEVCSPGGTTIEGVMSLEKAKFRFATADAVKAAYEKTAKLKK